ncbi:MAG: LPS export ABC transporter permease LptG [Steroidobacteraceae bacterium]
MRVLDRYILRAICGHLALVMAVLATLLGLFLYINEQGWIGIGQYGQLQALRYVLLNLPGTVLQFLPVGALIGTLLALGQMARGSELTVMRAAGVSIRRLCGAVLLTALLLLPCAVLLGEWIGPPLTQLARVNKAVDRNGSISAGQRGGAWVRDGERILHAEGGAGGAGSTVTVFEFDGPQRLASVARAASARQVQQGGWELEGVVDSRFGGASVGSSGHAVQQFELAAGTDFFSLVAASPRDLSLRQLWRATHYLDANQQDTRRHRFAFWSGIARLVAMPLTMLLAVPFLFGPLRSAGAGGRVMLGLGLGLLWFIVQRMVESGTVAFDLDPLWLAWLPTAMLAGVVAVLIQRVDAA